MSNRATSRKSLRIGVFAAVVVLTMILCMVMAGCNNEQANTGTTTAPAATVDSGKAESYDLYWNLDRALYDGKSEAGMSSRMPADDGYFHVRFFKDGEIIELRVADRKTVNALEIQNLMGLEFDGNGIVVGVIDIEDMPVEKLGWQFYVQSVGGKLIKVNSSGSMNGMEILLETNENTGIYDMSGVTGEVGVKAEPIQGDRILAVGNEDGKVLNVYIYERPNYMLSHEAECEHCEKTVTWYEWTKENALPLTTGHYQLMVDVSGVGQHSMPEDCKLCVDLNGHRVDGRSGARIYSLHNAGTELAIMDTSEAKTGRIAAHGKGDQGMCVWLRYGVFYLYDGILDASDASTTKNGTTVNQNSNTFFYMHGGELIGGTADVVANGKGGWSGGVGGTLFVGANSKFVMYDGIIRDGRAKTKITKYTAAGLPDGYTCGIGGNIYANTSSVIELNGGVIRDGIAESYCGNIYLGGKAELTINDTLISNGRALARTQNGGNLFVTSTAKVVMNGGTIRNGRVYNCGGNVYINGRFQMNDGIITDGKVVNWTSKKVSDTAASRNIFSVNGDFYMYGGRVAGGFQCVDTVVGTNDTILVVSARSVIFDEDGTGPHLSLSGAGDPVVVMVGQMHDEGKVGISAVQKAVFTKPTKVENTNNFVSDVNDADINWTEDGLTIGKIHCLCSQDPEIGDDEHKLGCDKVQYVWAPWTSATNLPTTEGYWYLTKDVSTGDNAVRNEKEGVHHIALDLNGKTVLSTGGRMYSLFENTSTYLADGKTIAPDVENSALHLTLTDTLGGGTVNFKTRTDSDQGTMVWGRWPDSKINILAGTYNGETVTSKRHAGAVITASGELNIYGGTLNGGNSTNGGIISGNNINIYGGTITGGTAKNGGNIYSSGTLNIYGGTISGGNASTYGGNIYSKGDVNILGGTVTEGFANGVGLYAQGGNIYMTGSGKELNISGENTVISKGKVVSDNAGKTWAPGGNIYANGGVKVTIDGGATIKEGFSADGHNIYITGDSTVLNLLDCTIHNTSNGISNVMAERGTVTIDGATITNVGSKAVNLCANETTKSAHFIFESGLISGGQPNVNLGGDDTFVMNGGTIENGSTTHGGNISITDTKFTMNGGVISGGVATGSGGNFALSKASELIINGGEIKNGTSTSDSGNIIAWDTSVVTLNNGTISGGSTNGNGGNIRVSDAATLNVNGGTITGGHAKDSGGNIVNYGLLNISGGLITNGKADKTSSNNIACIKSDAAQISTLNLSGGTIAGGIRIGNASGNVVINISGNPVVDKSLATANTPAESLNLTENNLNVGTMTSGAKICVAGTEGVFTNPVDASYVNYFKSEVAGSEVMHTADGLFLGRAMCVCGGKAVGVGDHKCENVLWTAWTSASTLPTTSGNYYLTKNVTASGVAFKNAGTINIDLNGFDYIQNGGDRAFRVRDDSSQYDSGKFVVTIGLTDSKGGGEVKVSHSGSQDGTIVWLTEGTNTFNLYAGILDASGVTTTSGKNGTAVKTLSNSTFNMYGGEIKGGSSPSAGGGAVAVYDTSTFNMYAGKVSGGKTGSSGGNFIVFGNLNVKGGTITGGEAISTTTDDKKGGNIAIQGGATVRISGGNITDGVSDDSGCNIHVFKDGKLYVSGGTISGGYRLRGTTKEYLSMTNLFSVNGYVEITGGTIKGMTVTNTEANGSTLKISGNPVIGTDPSGNGLYVSNVNVARPVVELGTLTNGADITVSVSGAFTNVTDQANAQYFKTNVADSAVVWIDDAKAMGVAAADEGKLYVGKVMCVCGGKAEGVGDHVCKDVIWTTWTESTMPSASGNYILTKPITTAQKDYTTAGTVISLDLNGQTITGNTGNNGRVLRLTNGVVFNITDTVGGGQIIGKGHATDQGGTVIMAAQSKLNIYAGTITSDRTHNTPKGGGVLYSTQSGTTITMYGGLITNGKSTGTAGNVWVNEHSTFVMYGGTITGGQSSGAHHGNIHCKWGNMELYGGTITGGVLVQSYNKDYSTIKMSGNPVVYGEGATSNLRLVWSTNNNSPANYPVIQLGKLTDGAKIHISDIGGTRTIAAPDGSYVITEKDRDCFKADIAGVNVILKNGKLQTQPQNS